MQLAPCAQHVKELHLWVRVAPWVLAEFLALHFPNLVRVHLRMNEFYHPTAREPSWSQVGVHLSLREFDIGFNVIVGQPFPREECRKALGRLTEVCPVLEVVRFGALFLDDGGRIDERNIPLDKLMDMRRTAEGEWKERQWGVS